MATRRLVDGCIPEVNSDDCEFNNCPNCSGRKLIGAVVSGFDPKADQEVDCCLGDCNTEASGCDMEAGGCGAETGGCNKEAGGCATELAGGCNTEAGGCNTEAGSCDTEVGGCDMEAGCCNTEAGCCNTEASGCHDTKAGGFERGCDPKVNGSIVDSEAFGCDMVGCCFPKHKRG